MNVIKHLFDVYQKIIKPFYFDLFIHSKLYNSFNYVKSSLHVSNIIYIDIVDYY